MEENNIKNRMAAFFSGKGFYIVLFVCLAVIGVSAWALLFAGSDESGASGEASVSVMAPVVESKPVTEAKTPTTSTDKFSEAVKPETSHKVNVPEAKPDTAKAAATPEDDSEKVDAKVSDAKLTFIWPLAGTVAVKYSPDVLMYNKTMADWRTHSGMDIAAQLGTKVMAVADGKVAEVYDDDLFGTTVVIDHGGKLTSIYSNLAAVPTVKEGDAVTMGSVIGSVGDTALAETAEVSHLHFAMKAGELTVDPAEYLPKK